MDHITIAETRANCPILLLVEYNDRRCAWKVTADTERGQVMLRQDGGGDFEFETEEDGQQFCRDVFPDVHLVKVRRHSQTAEVEP